MSAASGLGHSESLRCWDCQVYKLSVSGRALVSSERGGQQCFSSCQSRVEQRKLAVCRCVIGLWYWSRLWLWVLWGCRTGRGEALPVKNLQVFAAPALPGS